MCETMQSSHRLCPVMTLVRALLTPTVSGDGTGTHFCTPLSPSPHFSTSCPEKTHEFPENPAFFAPFYGGGPSVKSLGSHGGVRWGPKKKISWCGVLTTSPDPEDLVICMFSGLMVNHDHTHNNSSYTYFF